jgi:hypothetical protein
MNDDSPVARQLRAVRFPSRRAKRRRHPSAEYAMLNRLLAELQRTGGYIDQIVLLMEKGEMPEMPEARAAQDDTRVAIAALLARLTTDSE